jgi:hypothetical protein
MIWPGMKPMAKPIKCDRRKSFLLIIRWSPETTKINGANPKSLMSRVTKK